MEISKENVYKVGYAPVLGVNFNKQRNGTRRLLNFIRKNKIITIAMIVFFACIVLNLVLIYNFMKILSTL